jgi:hypothetical protein
MQEGRSMNPCEALQAVACAMIGRYRTPQGGLPSAHCCHQCITALPQLPPAAPSCVQGRTSSSGHAWTHHHITPHECIALQHCQPALPPPSPPLNTDAGLHRVSVQPESTCAIQVPGASRALAGSAGTASESPGQGLLGSAHLRMINDDYIMMHAAAACDACQCIYRHAC